MKQLSLFEDTEEYEGGRLYRPILTAVANAKGVMDVDTVKGCTLGLAAYPNGGCYGECYAARTASRYGIDFATSVSRRPTKTALMDAFWIAKNHPATWYRIGTAGDPSHDWDNTLDVCEALRGTGKIPVIITKHWLTLSENHLSRLKALAAVVNTSTSGMDTDAEIDHRVNQMDRIKVAGVKSVCRVVTCSYSLSEWGRNCKEKQDYLLSLAPVIDNPLRASKANERVANGDIILTRKDESIGGGKFVSLHDQNVYLGRCGGCIDQCGVTIN